MLYPNNNREKIIYLIYRPTAVSIYTRSKPHVRWEFLLFRSISWYCFRVNLTYQKCNNNRVLKCSLIIITNNNYFGANISIILQSFNYLLSHYATCNLTGKSMRDVDMKYISLASVDCSACLTTGIAIIKL